MDVVTVGHILTDIRIRTDEFAAPDKESRVIDMKYGPGGSAANSAIASVKLGKKAAVLGKVGMDDFGKLALETIMREGVDISSVKIKVGGRTGFTLVIINSLGEIIMYGYKGVAEEYLPEELDERIIRSAKHLHVASLRLDTTKKALEIAKDGGLTTTFDPGRRLSKMGIKAFREILPYTDYLLLNLKEFEMLTGTTNLDSGFEKILKAGCKNVIVKMGSKGAIYYGEEGEIKIEAFRVSAIDTTGAGDAFASGFFVALLYGATIEEALLFASATAALKVMTLGAQLKHDLKDVIEFLEERGHKISFI
ncbi:MAG: carbohydrate kinase family protein [Thermoplasmata archaeon]|nr:MAG: carbohydrate kinase family protein [Thermoplasmata archaeon]